MTSAQIDSQQVSLRVQINKPRLKLVCIKYAGNLLPLASAYAKGQRS